MGSYAASGGYWISADATRIFAEPASITGSIGVFGLVFDVKKLANDFGVTFDTVKTGKFADFETIARPKTPEEMAVMQGVVDWIYDQFVARVAEGRKLDPAKVRRSPRAASGPGRPRCHSAWSTRSAAWTPRSPMPPNKGAWVTIMRCRSIPAPAS